MEQVDSEGQQISYEERLVAYIDILGFKEIVRDAESDPARAREIIEKLNIPLGPIPEVLSEYFPGPISVRVFSDCVCVSCSPEHLNHMLYNLAWIQLMMSLDGFFMRGGLALGRHFENDLMIFSHGLVKAWQLEKSANYPRIVVDAEVAKGVSEGEFFEPDDSRVRVASLLRVGPDGLVFVDYLEFANV